MHESVNSERKMDTPVLSGSFSDRSTDTRHSFKKPDSTQLVKINTTRQPVKSYKRIATDEEEFREHLGDIIERDFFPRLAEAKGKIVDQDKSKNLRLNEYLEVYYNENRCCIPNIEYKEEFETKLSLQASIPQQKVDQAIASQNPLAMAIPSSTLTRNLESWPLSNEEILHLADNKPTISYENTALKVNPFEAKDQTVKTKLVMVRENETSFNFSEKMLPPRSFVSLTPSPNPSAVGSPFMTYGLLEKTPAQISSSTPKPGGGFSIKPVSAREEIAHKLERHATSRAKVTPSPLSRSKMFYDYRRGATPSSPWLSQQFDNIRSGRIRRSGTKTPTPRAAPIVRLQKTSKVDIAEKSVNNDLTDDLLKIPKIVKDI